MIYVAAIVQVFATWFAKRLLVTWFHPVAILFMLWSVVLGATALAAPDYYFSMNAFLAMLFFEGVALAGAVAGLLLKRATWGHRRQLRMPHVRLIAWASVALGVASVAALLRSNGSSLSSLLNLDVLFDVSKTFSAARYEDDYRMPVVSRVAQMFVFFALIICGTKFASDRRDLRTYEYFVPFFPLVLTAVVLTTRASIVFGGIFWLGGYVAGRLWKASAIRESLLTARGWWISAISLASFAVLFVVVQFLRGGITDIGRLPEVLSHLRKWPFGSFAGFSSWFDQRQGGDVSFGYYTFTGLFDLLGVRDRETGLYLDYADLGDGSLGNIYTMFRGLIEDFTIVGACGVLLTLGVASSVGLSMVMRQRVFGVWMLAAIYPVVLFSPIVSFYSFLGHVAAIALALGYMLLLARAPQS